MPTTAALAGHLLETAPEHEGWSLVESPNAAGCYDELQKWAKTLTPQVWCTDKNVRCNMLGLVLLWLESEAARRHASEGTLWPFLSSRNLIPWNEWVYAQLFNNAGNATQTHRDLLLETAEHFSLRHTFDEGDGMNWFRLIYLQFGFTHEDANKRLASIVVLARLLR